MSAPVLPPSVAEHAMSFVHQLNKELFWNRAWARRLEREASDGRSAARRARAIRELSDAICESARGFLAESKRSLPASPTLATLDRVVSRVQRATRERLELGRRSIASRMPLTGSHPPRGALASRSTTTRHTAVFSLVTSPVHMDFAELAHPCTLTASALIRMLRRSEADRHSRRAYWCSRRIDPSTANRRKR